MRNLFYEQLQKQSETPLICVRACSGEGLGSCKRCESRGIWNRTWMPFLYEIEGLEGCYCAECVREIVEERTGKTYRISKETP